MSEKTAFNLVEMISDDEQAFDQPCAYGNRVGGHSVYCHNEALGYRKCFYRWEPLEKQKACEGFNLNMAYEAEKDKPQ